MNSRTWRVEFRACVLAAFGATVWLAAPAAVQAQPAATGGSEATGTPAGESGGTAVAEVSEEDRTQAREHYRLGRRLLERSRPEEALEEFGQSYALYPHWATSNSMGVCHDRLGRPNDALRLYEQALREGGELIPENQRAEIEQRISVLRIQLGIREPTTGTIRVSTQPAGATVHLDGTDSGFTPVDLEAVPGPHRIDVELAGYEPNGVDVDVALGQTAQVALALVAAAVVPTNGRLLCASDPDGALVRVDGTEVGRTPLTLPELPSGEHRVRFEMEDGRAMEQTVRVPEDGTARVTVSFGGAVDQGWFWGIAGTALALGAGAAGTGAYGTLLWNEFNDAGTTRDRREEIQPLGRDLMLTTDVLASAAGAVAVTALVLAFFTDFGGDQGSIDVGYEGPAEPEVELPPPGEPATEGGPEPAEGGGAETASAAFSAP